MSVRSKMERAVDRAMRYVRKHGARDLAPAVYRSVAERLGVPERSRRTVDLSGVTRDPLEALSLAGRRRSPIIEVEFSRLRPYALAVAYSDLERNPFVRTAWGYANESIDTYENSVLHDFYRRWQPADIGDVYGVQGERSVYLAEPPTPDALPWRKGTWPGELDASRRVQEERLRARLGLEGGPHGFRSFGPVSEAAGERFFEAYTKLAASVTTAGYDPELGDPPLMELLTDGPRWAGRLLAGNHRAAVLAGLGHTSFRVTVSRDVVHRRDASRWPGVRSGIYTESQAIMVFDSFIDGTGPDGFPFG